MFYNTCRFLIFSVLFREEEIHQLLVKLVAQLNCKWHYVHLKVFLNGDATH